MSRDRIFLHVAALAVALGSAPGPRIELVLTPESVLEGRVVEAGTAIPVAGVFVSVGHDPATTPGKAFTDAEGHFRIRALPPGSYEVVAVSPNRWGRALASVRLGLGETVNDVVIEARGSLSVSGRIRLTLPESGTIAGRVVDERGAPAGGVTVSAYPDRGNGTGRTVARDDGSFVLSGLSPGAYRVNASRGARSLEGAGAEQLVTVTTGGTARTTIVVEAEREQIRGRGVGPDGDPLSDVFVEAEHQHGDLDREPYFLFSGADAVVTGSDGRFTIEKLPRGTFAVRAFRRVGGETVKKSVPTGADIELAIADEASIKGTLTGRAPERFRVAGRIVDASGAPIPAVDVSVDPAGMQFDLSPWRKSVATDSDGRFVLDHVVGGDGKLYARGTGVHEALDAIMEPITVPPGGTLDLPQRSLLPYDPGAVP